MLLDSLLQQPQLNDPCQSNCQTTREPACAQEACLPEAAVSSVAHAARLLRLGHTWLPRVSMLAVHVSSDVFSMHTKPTTRLDSHDGGTCIVVPVSNAVPILQDPPTRACAAVRYRLDFTSSQRPCGASKGQPPSTALTNICYCAVHLQAAQEL